MLNWDPVLRVDPQNSGSGNETICYERKQCRDDGLSVKAKLEHLGRIVINTKNLFIQSLFT